MSDIINPEPKHVEPVVPAPGTLEPVVPHSGKLSPSDGGELPVIEHENPLSPNVLPVPEHPGSLTEQADNLSPAESTERNNHSNKRKLKIMGGGLLAAAAAVGSLFIFKGSDGQDNKPTQTEIDAAAEAAEKAQEELFDNELYPSYAENFEPEAMDGTTAQSLANQTRTDLYYAITARTPELRDKYINYIVNNDPELFEKISVIVNNASESFGNSSLSTEDYLAQEADNWEVVSQEVIGDETLRLNIKVSDDESDESVNQIYDFRSVEDSTAPNGTRYVVVGLQS